MKLIPLRETETFKTIDVIKTVIERPSRGAGIAAIRSGVRVLDALDQASKTELCLEDSDYAVLVGSINEFTFAIVSRDLLAVLDDIINAKAPIALVV